MLPIRTAPPIRMSRPVLAAVALVASLTACTAQAADGGSSGGSGAAKDASPVKVTVVDRAAGKPVSVTTTGGTLAEVKVVDGEGGILKGRTGTGGTSWASERKAAPGTSYTVEVTPVPPTARSRRAGRPSPPRRPTRSTR
ncbi:hypothetical protein STANM309S_05299 [Streptomyces tanashiensis]